jgi:hypothetical protein
VKLIQNEFVVQIHPVLRRDWFAGSSARNWHTLPQFCSLLTKPSHRWAYLSTRIFSGQCKAKVKNEETTASSILVKVNYYKFSAFFNTSRTWCNTPTTLYRAFTKRIKSHVIICFIKFFMLLINGHLLFYTYILSFIFLYVDYYNTKEWLRLKFIYKLYYVTLYFYNFLNINITQSLWFFSFKISFINWIFCLNILT